MQFSIDIPLGVIEPAGAFQTQEAAAEMGRALEAAGAAACYVTDHPAPVSEWLHAHGHDAVDPFTSLAFVAAATTRLRLHTNVVVLPYRNPFITAKLASTLQVFSHGRLILGVGVGYQQGEFDALGVDFSKRGMETDEALETLRTIWKGGAVVAKGRGFEAKGNEPRPLPDPAPPIWIGGGSDKAVERAARWGDGWSPFFAAPTQSANNRASAIQSVAHLAEKITLLKDLRANFGRTGPFDVSVSPQIHAHELNQAEADRFIDTAGALAEVGVSWCVASLTHSSRQAYLDAVQWLGEAVIKRV